MYYKIEDLAEWPHTHSICEIHQLVPEVAPVRRVRSVRFYFRSIDARPLFKWVTWVCHTKNSGEQKGGFLNYNSFCDPCRSA